GMENSLFQGERILVNKWSYGLRVPLMSLFSYHRWCERSVRQQDVVVFNNPAAIGQPTIDRREIYISRCIGTPGDTLLVDSLFSVSSPEAQLNPDKKRLYTYPAAKEQLITSLMQTLSITNDGLMGSNDSTHVRSFSRYEYYLLEQAISDQNWIQPLTEKSEKELKPLIVPGKGKALRVYPWNITLLRNTLVMHEGKQAEIKNDTLYIDGKPTQHCFFTKDYYWMASNNSVNLSDSRLFGFVPQDHIIGKASLIWFSKEKGTGIFDGYRWNRFFQSVK
ncbi:S26 family signal peptidase, partial [Bacteroides thetaiotaomicron]